MPVNKSLAGMLVALTLAGAACGSSAKVGTTSPSESSMVHESPSPPESSMMHESKKPSPSGSSMMHESKKPSPKN